MREQIRKWIAVIMAGIFLLCMIYLGLVLYYRNGFSLNTWVNGIYCTGRTVEDVNAELLSRLDLQDEITVIGYVKTDTLCTEKSWRIRAQDIKLAADYTEGLKRYLVRQDPWLWVDNFLLHSEHTVQPVVSYGGEELLRQWEKIVAAAQGEKDYRIVYQEAQGYSLYDGLHGHMDEEKAFRLFQEAITAGKDSVDLVKTECYHDLEPTEEQRALAALWEKIEEFQNNGPVYDFGDGSEQLDGGTMARFLVKDDQEPYLPILDQKGCLKIDEEAVDAYVESMVQQHNTTGKEWQFLSTRGTVIPVKGEKYETVLNQKDERAWLGAYLQMLSAGNIIHAVDADTEPHIPSYLTEAFNRSSTTIGGTYIEVDMGCQKLYYYENGECLLETDVVTGDMRRKLDTPEGVNYVYAKSKNRVLRGPGYSSSVKFWMPVNGGIGIHDATWRKEFGGDLYKTDGSHGCVNLPLDKMRELYDMVEIGTPVVMFYAVEEEEQAEQEEETVETEAEESVILKGPEFSIF